MFKRLMPLVLLMYAAISFAQQKHAIYYPGGNIHVTYQTKNGLLNGMYTCYYENGTKKAEGSYLDNQRKGTWKVWDENGTERSERYYENSYNSKNEYGRFNPNAISDGDEKGKGQINDTGTIGSKTDIFGNEIGPGRIDLIAKNTYNGSKTYPDF